MARYKLLLAMACAGFAVIPQAAAGSASSGCESAGICSQREDLEVSVLLQFAPARAATAGHFGLGKRSAKEQGESDEVHTVFVCDCSRFLLWQTELLFFSAQWVGQRGPITAIFSGCDEERKQPIKDRLGSLKLPQQYTAHFVAKFNDDLSHVINKPYGVQAWLREKGPDRDIVACVDPDFVFTRPLTAAVDRESLSTLLGGKADAPRRSEKVRRGVVAAQRWTTFFGSATHDQELWFPLAHENMSHMDLLTWVCSGNVTGKSGCTGVTKAEASSYHATGPPYLAHKDDWEEWLADTWSDITARLHSRSVDAGRERSAEIHKGDSLVYPGYFVDMLSWTLANIHHGRRELIVQNLQALLPEPFDNWAAINAVKGDPCEDPLEDVLAQPGLPNFLHYTGTYDAWNKRWFTEGSRAGEHIFKLCNTTEATDAGLANLVAKKVDMRDPAMAFVPCVTRRMFAAAAKRVCPGKRLAEHLDGVAAGFSF